MDSNNMSIYGAGQDCSTDVEGNGGSEVFVQAFDDAYQNRTVGTHDSGSANLTRPPNNCASFEHDDLERKSPQATLQSFPTPPNFPPPNSDFTQSFPTLPDSQPPDSNFTQSLEEPNAPVSSCANDSGGFTSRYFLSTEDDVGEIAPVLHNLFSPDESGMDDPGPISDAEQPLGIPDAAWQNVEPQRSRDGVEAFMFQPDAQQSLGIPDAARQNVEPQRSHDGVEALMIQPDAQQSLGIPDAARQNVEPQRSHDGVEAFMFQPDAQQSLGIPDAARQNVEPQRSHDGLEAFMVQPNVYPQATTGANTEIHGCHPGVNTSITEHPPRSPSEVPNSLSLDSTTRISQISPSAIAKKSTGKRKLDLDCATAFFETAKLMQCATNGQSEKRGFLNSFNQFLTRPCAESASLSQDQYRMKALCFLGERPTREVSRKQVLAKFTSEACIEAELARSFPWSEQDGFSFGPITTYLWNKIQLAQQKVQPVQKARRAQVEEKCTHEAQKTKRSWFEGGSYWSEPAKQCLVDLLFKSHRQHSMTVSQIADASYWFLTKFHVEVLIYSRCACPDCILWGMYDKQCTPGELVLEYSRLQFEVYYTLLLAHKYDDPMLIEWYPQLGALSERERKLLLEKLHDCDTCPQCLSSRKSARTRCNSTSSEFTDDGYGDDHEDKNEDEDLMDEGTRIQRVTADVAAAVAHTLFPQSEDFFDAEDYDEVDEDDEKSKNDEDAISLSLGRLALNNQ